VRFRKKLIQKIPCALITQIELSNKDQLDLLWGELLIARFLVAFFDFEVMATTFGLLKRVCEKIFFI